MPKNRLSVIVPAYNEETRLEPFLLQLIRFKKRNSFILEIIVVNDGSTDNTQQLLDKYRKSIKIVSYSRNRGKGYAVKQGILAAKGDLIAFMDADGATPASQLAEMYAALQGNDVVVGNRKTKKARIVARQPLYRRFLSWGFNATVALLFNFNVKDVLCGFKGMKASLAKQIAKQMVSNRWVFDVEIIARATAMNAKIGVVPIQWRHIGGSKMKVGLNTFRILIELFRLRAALRKADWRSS